MRKPIDFFVAMLVSLSIVSVATAADFAIVGEQSTADLFIDSKAAKVVSIAGGLLANDVQRITGKALNIKSDPAALGSTALLVGTVGDSGLIDHLVAAGKITADDVKGQWEAFAIQTVVDPLPNVHHALVIFGSDRRGTAYGVMELSARMGVSPWYWWGDVPTVKSPTISIHDERIIGKSPKVKYRGIFLNDEDWGLRPWSSKTFDPATGQIGPKTNAKIFELMLRLRLNYIWPAMHPDGVEFSMFPGNAQTADDWAIVMGSSHCEPMMRNNVYWPKAAGVWRYDVNHDAIFNYWKQGAKALGQDEAIWTYGIRGIHDSQMSGSKELPARVKMVEGIFNDQQNLVDQHVTRKYGPPASCFVPYKEVLPLYDAGMKVPENVTLVWPDDNYGYVRRLGTPAERQRAGGSGVYYHLSYWGSPHSYLWVESTPPGLMWQELRKTYDNESKNIWVVNVGDLKPAECCLEFFAKLAFDPQGWGPDAQQKFLVEFDRQQFGDSAAPAVAELQAAYYKLASVRKPEHISYSWVDSLSTTQAGELKMRYQSLLDQEAKVVSLIPADRADSYFEMVGYAARMLSATAMLYMGDDATAKRWKKYIDDQTSFYNDKVAGGKWHLMMPSTMEGVAWPIAVGGKAAPVNRAGKKPVDAKTVVVDAASCDQNQTGDKGSWQTVAGLGWSGRGMSVLPATPQSSWDINHLSGAPSLQYRFEITAQSPGQISLHALPTLRLTLGGKLRVAYAIDDEAPAELNVPGGESDNELGKIRSNGVMSNRVTMTIPTASIKAGKHVLKVFAMDPGVVLDQIEFPE